MQKSLLFSSILTILGLSLGIPGLVQSQQIGFSVFNERNHPQLKWVSAETEHFIISYPEHLAGIEAEAAAIAEATYEALSANLEVTFDYKIRIFLSDEDEILNGFAVPFRNSFTNIWVNINDVAEGWSGEEKWLRTVLAHELAHIFHYQAVKSNIRIIGALGIAPSTTAPWTEGIAQYQTEPWHALRGDIMLRTAVYDGRPWFTDGRSVRNGELMYASGNSQLRYFTSTYGDTTLAQILAHRQKPLKGLIQFHSFPKAFREVTGKPFNQFQDEWRRHVSVYYFSVAGQMERSDSLGVKPETLPGLLIQSTAFSPDTTQIAVIALKSAERPIRELSVIKNDSTRARKILDVALFSSPVSWSPDGNRLVYSLTTRGVNSSLLNDLYLYDLQKDKRTRLTHSRRATNPVFSADGNSIYFVGSENGTANVFQLNPETGSEVQLTQHTGDYQIGKLAMHPSGSHIAYATFGERGERHIAILDLSTRTTTLLTDGSIDDRDPVWSPDGSKLAFNSLRDQVANIFVVYPFTDSPQEERVTALFTGGQVFQWLPPDSTHQAGRFLIRSTDSKINNKIYLIDASRRPENPAIDINPSYTRWLTHTPPNTIAKSIAPDPSLIQNRYSYNSFRNISHITTIPFPYYGDAQSWGFGAVTTFVDPLGKHFISALGVISVPSFKDNSLLFLSYTNNQFRPSWSLNAYHNSFTGRFYERDYLFTLNSGAFLLGSLPRDWIDSPYANSVIYSRLRVDYANASNYWDASQSNTLPIPESGTQADLRIGMRIHAQKPYRYNLIHPLDGTGLETRVTLATKSLSTATEFVRPDIIAYKILPGGGDRRVYLYGRAVAQWGKSLPQDYIGFSRYDEIEFGAPIPGLDVLYSDNERVRGFSDYVLGSRLLFGTLEYRMPFSDDLETSFLGIISLGRTSLALFADGGMVWSGGLIPDGNAVARAGAGAELKNVLSFGALQIVHSLGFAQPVQDFTTERNQEIYYRIRAVVPF